MAVTSTKHCKTDLLIEQYGQVAADEARSPHHAAAFSSVCDDKPVCEEQVSFRYVDSSLQPTPESTVMELSCPKVQTLYKEIIAGDNEYYKWKWYGAYTHMISRYATTEEFERRGERLRVEGEFLALSLKVKKLYQQRATGSEYLRERTCYTMSDIAGAISEDIEALKKYLCDGGVEQIARSEYCDLSKRVKQLASMEKTFERSHFIMSSGKECCLPSSNRSSMYFNHKLLEIKREFPDSGQTSFMGGMKALFTSAPKASSAANRDLQGTPSSKHLERVVAAQVSTNMLYDGWRRQNHMVNYGRPW